MRDPPPQLGDIHISLYIITYHSHSCRLDAGDDRLRISLTSGVLLLVCGRKYQNVEPHIFSLAFLVIFLSWNHDGSPSPNIIGTLRRRPCFAI